MIDPMKLMTMLKKANDFKNKIEAELRNIKIQGKSGDNIVKITMNGQFEVENVEIDEDIFKQEDCKFLEDLIKTCINDSTKKIKTTLLEKLQNLTNGLNFFK